MPVKAISFDFEPASDPPPRSQPDGPLPDDMPPDLEPVALFRPAPAFLGRTLPHSLEAEEYLLSAVFIDAPEVLAKCEAARIQPESFYDAKHGIVYACAVDLHRRKVEVATWTVAEELKRTRQLDAVGGYSFLVQVSSRAPTTAQASFFIEKVREQAILRELIRSATVAVEDCYGYSGGLAGFAAELEAKITAVTKRASGAPTWSARPLTEFALPPENDPSLLLGKYRYLCRGGGMVLVGSSGTGKSSSALQMAVCWALGRDFLGITCTGPLRSIVVQAEDDEGDIAEVWASLMAAMKLTEDEIAAVRSRVLVIEDRVTSGTEFLAELRSGCAHWKPDVVFLNPLLSFAGCAIAEQEKMTAFLRGGLNRVNAKKKWAYIVVHHTNKPPSEKVSRNWNEYMYAMAGSAELTNWARAVITIEAKKEEGQFLFRLAKRGRRAGVTAEVEVDEEGTDHRVEIVTKIHAQHSTRKLQLDATRTLQMMVWEPGNHAAEEAEGKPKREPRRDPGRKPKHGFDDFRGLWPVGVEKAMPFGQLKRLIGTKVQMSDSALIRVIKDAEADGKLSFHTAADRRLSGYYVPL